MDGQNYLGIYLSKDRATAVCLAGSKIVDHFSVSVEDTEESGISELVNLIGRTCLERELNFSEVSVALDCTMFMQHAVHSEFKDAKQIGATIRFDTEEVLATDITDLAISFNITCSDENGSELNVFTAKQKILSEIILSFQSNNIDPVAIEPDVNCLSGFIRQNMSLSKEGQSFFGIFSSSRGYFIIFSDSNETSIVRTFLVGPTQDRNAILTREVPITVGLVESKQPVENFSVFDSESSVDHEQLSEKLGAEVNAIDLAGSVESYPEDVSPVEFAIAYGAAAAHLEKSHVVDFRNDFMPYQGKKLRLQKTLKFLSAAIVVLVLGIGFYFQLQLMQRNKYADQLRRKFEKDYSAVMLGSKPPKKTNPVKKLSGELRRIRDAKSGQLSVAGKASISAKLTMVLEAFNRSAAQTNLNIDTVTITSKTITVVGDTSSRPKTLKLREAIEKSKLKIVQDSLETKGGRDNFRITVSLKK